MLVVGKGVFQFTILVNFFFYLGFLSRTFTNHRTVGEGRGHYFNSSLPLQSASQKLRHQPGDYCRELTSAHSQLPDSNWEPLVSVRKSLTTELRASDYIEIIPLVWDQRKEKRLFGSIYIPPLQNNQYFVSILSDLLNFYSNECDNKVVLGDFNLEPSNPSMLSFMDSQIFVKLIKNKTCFKGAGSCTDLILTNRKCSFKNTSSYKTAFSSHHHLIYSVMVKMSRT